MPIVWRCTCSRWRRQRCWRPQVGGGPTVLGGLSGGHMAVLLAMAEGQAWQGRHAAEQPHS